MRARALTDLPTPHLDTTAEAEQAGAEIKQALSITAEPQVNGQSIKAALADAQQLEATLQRLGPLASNATAQVVRMKAALGTSTAGAPPPGAVPASHHTPAYGGD